MKTKDPIVSVIIPVFNQAPYIRGAIESVLNQSFKDVEILVVDDGSTDELTQVIGPWVDQGVIRYVHQANQGAAAARNLGIRMTKGRFLKFLDSDDFLYPQQLELQVQHLEHKSDQVVSVTDFEFEFGNKERKYVKIGLGRGSMLARIIHTNIGPLHSCLVSRSSIEAIGGFDEQLTSFQDPDLWLRLVIEGSFFEKVDYLGCCYRILKGSVSSNPKRQLRNCCKVMEKLNLRLLPKLEALPQDAVDELLWVNTQYVHRCLIQKIKPSAYLPTALKVSYIICARKKEGLKKFLLKTMGIENFMCLQYMKASFTDPDYSGKLNLLSWRNEMAGTL